MQVISELKFQLPSCERSPRPSLAQQQQQHLITNASAVVSATHLSSKRLRAAARNKARKRAAALNFLASISLDGVYGEASSVKAAALDSESTSACCDSGAGQCHGIADSNDQNDIHDESPASNLADCCKAPGSKAGIAPSMVVDAFVGAKSSSTTERHQLLHHRQRRQSAADQPLPPLFVEVPDLYFSPTSVGDCGVAVRYRTQSEYRTQLSVPVGGTCADAKRWSRQRGVERSRTNTTSSSIHSSLSGAADGAGVGASLLLTVSNVGGGSRRGASSSTSERGGGVGADVGGDFAEIVCGPFASSNGTRRRTRTRSFRGIESFYSSHISGALPAVGRQRHKSSSMSTSNDSITEYPISPPKGVYRCAPSGPAAKKDRLSERCVLITNRKSPFYAFSIVKFYRDASASARSEQPEQSKLRHHSSGSLSPTHESLAQFGVAPRLDENQFVSYGYLLQPSAVRRRRESGSYKRYLSVDEHEAYLPAANQTGLSISPIKESVPLVVYHPHLLDNPDLTCGKHMTVLTFSSYVTSILEYVRPSDLKKDLNQQFRERFPHIQLTLSKLRSLKADLYRVAKKSNTDLWALAQAYVFFEKLALKGLVNKVNRKCCCATCLVLSAKLNDVKGPDLANLFEELESAFRLTKREILLFELPILVSLEFSLVLPDHEISPHRQRLEMDSAR